MRDKKAQVQIRLVSWGTGNLIDKIVYVNSLLLERPDLYSRVINHEVRHLNGETWVDWREPFDFEMWKWMALHPSSWIQLLPFFFWRGKIIYSKTWLAVWIFVLAYVWLLSFMIRVFL